MPPVFTGMTTTNVPNLSTPEAGRPALPRRFRRRARRRSAIAAVLALAGLAGAAAVSPVPFGSPSASAQPQTVLGKSEKHLTSWGIHDGYTPSCGSKNISGDGGKFKAQWKITSSLGSGSKVYAGTEWDLTAVLDGHTSGSNYNDGPDPLTLQMVPSGPIQRLSVTPSVNSSNLDSEVAYWGDGSVGPIGSVGSWGYAFDSNSSPKLKGLTAQGSDGVDVTMKLHVKALAPGVVKLPKLQIGGWDATPTAASVSCSTNLDWSWTVIAPEKPSVTGEQVKTDASYTDDVTFSDANGGAHEVVVDVLKNDDDLNTVGGVGNTDDIRLSSWPTQSAEGGNVDCGANNDAPKDPANFTTLSKGPCRYTPPENFVGIDEFSYTVRQKTDQAERNGTATVKIVGNHAPAAAPTVVAVTQNTDDDFSVDEQISDPEGDPTVCVPQLIKPATPNIGTVTMNQNCTFHWDSTDPQATGNVVFTYRVCDTHLLVADNAHGANVLPAGDYNEGSPDDLSTLTSRRCTDAEVTIAVQHGLIAPPHAVKDVDKVDAGYSGDGVGPYTVAIPVFANDFDPNGPKPMNVSILTGPKPSEGTATMLGNTHVQFTPADGFSGPVSFTYRNCEDPATQNPPYEGNGICGVGTVQIDVLPNAAPVASDDDAVVEDGQTLTDLALGQNDVEPDGESLVCATNPVAVSDPSKVGSLDISSSCQLDLEPADGATGPLDITYQVCDDHHLTSPMFPDLPYGADGRFPNGLAPRCTTAVAHLELAAPLPDPGEEPDGQVGDGPTDEDPGDPDGGPGPTTTNPTPGPTTTNPSTVTPVTVDGTSAAAGSTTADGNSAAAATNGSLPVTGSASALLTFIAMAALLAGMILVAVSRIVRPASRGDGER